MSRPVLAALTLVLVAPATLTSVAATSAPTAETVRQTSTRAPAYDVVARSARANVIADLDAVRLTGRVRPRADGQKVLLQQRREGRKRWTRTDTARIKSNGTFWLQDFPSTPGIRRYRVVKPASNGLARGVSKTFRVSVWAWRRLAQQTPSAASHVYTEDTPTFGNVPYRSSISLERPGTPGFAEYTLGRRCRTLRATYALTDPSQTGATGQVRVSADGVVRVDHPLAVGVIIPDFTDVSSVFRLRFDLTGSATPSGWSAVGTPEVLCLDP